MDGFIGCDSFRNEVVECFFEDFRNIAMNIFWKFGRSCWHLRCLGPLTYLKFLKNPRQEISQASCTYKFTNSSFCLLSSWNFYLFSAEYFFKIHIQADPTMYKFTICQAFSHISRDDEVLEWLIGWTAM